MVIVNLRNNTDFWVLVDGLADKIAPNTELDNRTYQWVSNENKQIKFFSNDSCEGSPILVSSISFDQSSGIKVNRGNLNGEQVIKLDADCKSYRVNQDENGSEEVLINWSEVDEECVVNLSFNK